MSPLIFLLFLSFMVTVETKLFYLDGESEQSLLLLDMCECLEIK